MNRAQRLCIVAGLLVAAALIIFPPVVMLGRQLTLFWSQIWPIDTSRLFWELAIVGILTAAAVVFSTGSSAASRQSSVEGGRVDG